jgi:hypothetical protein
MKKIKVEALTTMTFSFNGEKINEGDVLDVYIHADGYYIVAEDYDERTSGVRSFNFEHATRINEEI